MLLNLRSQYATTSPRAAADAVITALTPAAWYRNATDVVSSGGFASIWADYASSDKGLVCPNVNNNYASVPDSVAVSVTGDMELIFKVLLNDWTPAVNNIIAAKTNVANNFAFDCYIATTGRVILRRSIDGAAVVSATSSAAPTVSDATFIWLKITAVSSTGKVNFYTSSDGANWTILGIEQTITSGPYFDGTSDVRFGNSVSGLIYRAIIKDGIDGTTVFDADFSAQAIGTASFTESSSNAATVTINTSGAAPAHIGKARDLLQGTGTNQPAYAAGVFTFDGADNFLKTNAFTLNQPETVYLVFKQITWTNDDSIYDGNADNSMRILQLTATPNLSAYAGSGGVNTNPDLALDTFGVVGVVYNGASSSLQLNATTPVTGSVGAGNAGGFTLGAGGSRWSNIAVKEAVIFAAAHSDAERTSVITALNNALTVF